MLVINNRVDVVRDMHVSYYIGTGKTICRTVLPDSTTVIHNTLAALLSLQEIYSTPRRRPRKNTNTMHGRRRRNRVFKTAT